MSTTRCKHGNITSDTMGSYACAECDPASRIKELEVEVERLLAENVRLRAISPLGPSRALPDVSTNAGQRRSQR